MNTPRTDEQAGALIDCDEVVPANFARQLERELIDATIRWTQAEQDFNDLRERHYAQNDTIRALRAENAELREEIAQLDKRIAEESDYADETHARHEALVEQIAKLKDENAVLSAELKEQAVVNGKGGEREAKLLAELDKLRNENARLNGQTRWQCTCGGTDCDGQRENVALREELNCQKICASDLAEKVLELRKDKEQLMAREKALDELTAESQRLGLY